MPTSTEQTVYGLRFKRVVSLRQEHWRVYDTAQREIAYVKTQNDKVLCWSTRGSGRKKVCVTEPFQTPKERAECFAEIAMALLLEK